LAKIADHRVAGALKRYLVPPRACLLEWDYGHVHPEFAEPRYPGFIVAEFPGDQTCLAYSQYGFGRHHPWGLIPMDRPRYGMDAGWYATIEDAFRASRAWDEPPPPGYEVD
jgi:hypothetical protein